MRGPGSAFTRFLLSGAFNTAVTYALYLVLLRIAPYRVSYTISYVAGIVLAYELNRAFVFRTGRSVRSALATPLIYLLQYLLGLAIVTVSISRFEIEPRFAPLLSVAITVPVTFVLVRYAFRRP